MFDLNSSSLVTSLANNCLSCSLYLHCKDKSKSVIWSCSRYTTTPDSKKAGKLRLADAEVLDYNKLVLDAPDVKPLALEETAEYDIYKKIRKVLRSNSQVAPDIKIDDSDFKQAPNFFTFCMSKKYLGQKPFLEQAILGTRVFAEYCTRCSDLDWLENHQVDDSLGEFRDRIQLLTRGVCKKCGARKSELVKNKELNFYNEMAICAGQRGGKSALVGMMSAYLVHWLLMLRNPNEIYKVLPSEILRATFVAVSYDQAHDTLWVPFHSYVSESAFFSEYNKFLTHTGNKTGEELYKLRDTFLFYRHRRLFICPAGPDIRMLRGRSRFLASIDEIAYFDNEAESKKVKLNASGVHGALGRSLLTLRSAASRLIKQGHDNVPTGYFLNISSPFSPRDKITELVKQAQGSRKVYGCVRATWEMNPTITREDLDEEFRNDPVKAMTDYGAQPPLSANPFISSKSLIEKCFGKPNTCRIVYQIKKSRDGTKERWAYIEKIKRSGKPSVLALDAGHVSNSFACAVGHLKDGLYPIITTLVEIQPLPGIPLNYSLIYENIIAPLIEARNVKYVAADRWNSLKILSDCESDFDTVKKVYSLKYADMVTFKDYLRDRQLNFPAPAKTIDEVLAYDHSDYPGCFNNLPAEHAVLQLLTVQDTGSKVIKGDQLTDDLVRAMTLACTVLINPDNAGYFNAEEEEEVGPTLDINSMAVFRGMSGGGGSAGGGDSGGSDLGMIMSRAPN